MGLISVKKDDWKDFFHFTKTEKSKYGSIIITWLFIDDIDSDLEMVQIPRSN